MVSTSLGRLAPGCRMSDSEKPTEWGAQCFPDGKSAFAAAAPIWLRWCDTSNTSRKPRPPRRRRRPRAENITIRDSRFSASTANAAQIGFEIWGDFENLSWSNMRVLGGAKSGIGIQMNDGAIIKKPQLRQRHDDEQVVPVLRASTKTPGHAENVRFRKITASNIVAGNTPAPGTA